MPSSHAQFVAFSAVYLGLFLVFRHTNALTSSHILPWPVIRMVLAVGSFIGASAVAWSRIYLNYHTPRQVLTGFAAGVVCAVSWFFVTSYLRTSGWIDWALDLEVSRKLRIRDLVVNEDLAEAGWKRWDETRKLRRRSRANGSSRKAD